MRILSSFAGLAMSVLTVAGLTLSAVAADQAKIKVMLLTGQCSQYHNWAVSSKVLQRILEEPGIFSVEAVRTPAKGEDLSGFRPDFSPYQVVVLDYEGADWPEPTQEAFAKFIRDGGGLVAFHATDNAFPKWAEFNEMIGVGGWGGRTAAVGPKVRWREGKMVLDDSPGTAGHPAKHDFLVVTRSPGHPVMQGLPAEWLHANDELYSQLRGPAKNLEVLATASADPAKQRGGTGENEPMLMAIQFGKGRIFHTTLGHVGPRDTETADSVNCVGFIATLQRGTEWAATGKVTQSVPRDFPLADKTSVRKP